MSRSRYIAGAVVVGAILGMFVARAAMLTFDGHGLDVYFTARGHVSLYLWAAILGAFLVPALVVAALFRLRHLREKRRGEHFVASNPAAKDVLDKWRGDQDS